MFRRLLSVGLGVSVMLTAGCAYLDSVNPLTSFSSSSPIDGYKDSFTVYYEGDRIGNDKQGIRLFANDTAMRGINERGRLPYGSVLVGEVYGVETDNAGNTKESSLGRRMLTDVKTLIVMERGEGFDDGFPSEEKVGDWRFSVYSPDGEKLDKDVSACRECHRPLNDMEFVWSYEHLAKK